MNIELSYTPPQLDIFFPSKPERHTIIPKGRRFGATRGAAHACIEWGVEGCQMLWGDTIHGNIIKYVERYFLPAIKSNGIRHEWKAQDKVLKIMDGYIDFRSADNPANWEGFGYSKVVLNEAGIILKDPYLYTNAVRPMMIDPGIRSELYALGVPKGMWLKDGSEHPFYTLWKKVGTNGYRGKQYSSYDNKLLSEEDIAELEEDIDAMDPTMAAQEIYGEFLERSAGNPFIHTFRPEHKGAALRRPLDMVFVSVDFNVEPFCAIMAHIWQDGKGHHFHVFDEIVIRSGTIREMSERIRAKAQHTHLLKVTGDRGGASRRITNRDNSSLFEDLRNELRLSRTQILVPPNPTHLQSREACNYVFAHHPDLIIDEGCTGLLSDIRTVEIDSDGKIVKADRSQASQRADLLDGLRYMVNTYLLRWIDHHRNALRIPGAGGRPELLRR